MSLLFLLLLFPDAHQSPLRLYVGHRLRHRRENLSVPLTHPVEYFGKSAKRRSAPLLPPSLTLINLSRRPSKHHVEYFRGKLHRYSLDAFRSLKNLRETVRSRCCSGHRSSKLRPKGFGAADGHRAIDPAHEKAELGSADRFPGYHRLLPFDL